MNKLISKIPFDKDIISGGFWSAALNATDRIVWLIRTVVLARLLAPDAFGTMGLCLICLDSMRKIVYFGLDEALIGNKDDNIDKYLD
ncbi:oligosaccharide flippase family protein, partial [Halorubrum ezzemoulense]